MLSDLEILPLTISFLTQGLPDSVKRAWSPSFWAYS